MSDDEIKVVKKDSNCSLSSVGHLQLGLETELIFSQLRLPFFLDDAKVQDKIEVLNLNIGIKGQKKIENISRLDSKSRKAKKEAAEEEDEEEEVDEKIVNNPYSAHLVKNY
jgi:hypothetical protein